VRSAHLLLGLVREGQGLGAKVLNRQTVDLEDLRRRVHLALGQSG